MFYICSKCDSNYVLDENRCYKSCTSNIANCELCHSSKCIRCNLDYYLTENNECQPI